MHIASKEYLSLNYVKLNIKSGLILIYKGMKCQEHLSFSI